MKKLSLETYVILIALISSGLVSFLSSSITIALPSIANDFGMSVILQNWVAIIFFLVIAMFSIPCGKISSKYGLKKSLLLGILLFLIGSIGSAIAFSSLSLIVFRIIQGLGATFLNVTSISMIVSAVNPKNRGRAIGLNIAGVYVGLSVAPVLGGILTYNLGWRSIFYITIPFLLLVLILIYLKINKEWKTSENDPIDVGGSIVFSIAILLVIYGFTILNELYGVVLTAIGLILLVLFFIWETKQKYPIFNMKLFKNAKFSSSLLASLISYLATFVITYILNYHLQYIRAMDPQTAGMILLITPLFMAILAPFSGKLSDMFNSQKLAALGMTIVSLALFILIFLSESMPLYIIGFAMLLQGVGYGLFSSPNTNSIMSSVPLKENSSASAAISTIRVIGQTMSLGILTVIFAIVIGNVPIVPKYYGLLMISSQISCIISFILCIIAVIISLIGLKSDDLKKTNNI